jgi:hypothetical protein
MSSREALYVALPHGDPWPGGLMRCCGVKTLACISLTAKETTAKPSARVISSAISFDKMGISTNCADIQAFLAGIYANQTELRPHSNTAMGARSAHAGLKFSATEHCG